MIKKLLIASLALMAVGASIAYVQRSNIALTLVEKVATERMKNPLDGLSDGLHVGLCGTGSPFPDPQRAAPIVFDHHFFSRGKRGDEAIYQASLARNNLLAGEPIISDPFPLQTDSELLSRERIAKEFGVITSTTIFDLPLGEWSPPVQSPLGVHLFKVSQKNAGRTMTLEEAGSQLRSDLIAAQREAVNDAGLAALRATYTIKEAP